MRRYEMLVAGSKSIRGIRSRDFFNGDMSSVLDELFRTIVTVLVCVLVFGVVAFVGIDVAAICAMVGFWGVWALWVKVLSVFGFVLANGFVLGFILWLRQGV